MENYGKYLSERKRTTPVKLYIWEKEPVDFPKCRIFYGSQGCKLVFGQWDCIAPILRENGEKIADYILECDRRNSAVPLLEIQNLSARIEPGAIIREGVTIGENAVILMGAVLNIGASVGAGTMIDMGAVLGGGAIVGNNCHIGAGAVLAGMVEPACKEPVVIEDGVFIGANAVLLEGIRVGKNAVVGAGAVVTENVPPSAVVAGCPARFLKFKDEKTAGKTGLTDGLR